MASNTPNLGLLKKDPMTDGNETFNIEMMLNENWDKIDTAVGQVREGLENVNVDIPDASLTEKGIVQLSSATNGTRENVAATEKAVKAAYDRGSAAEAAALPKTIPDNRSVATKPSDYNQNVAYSFKSGSVVGLANEEYVVIHGFKGWNDDSGGVTHEYASGGTTGKLYHRTGTSSNNTWGPWRLNIDESYVVRGGLPAGTNLDTVTSAGNYQIGAASSYSNIPQNMDWGVLEVAVSGSYVIQTLTSVTSQLRMFRTRTENSNGWSTWRKILQQSDYDALFQSVANGKQAIASAISGKGVPASGSDEFTVLANKISQIKTGIQVISGILSSWAGPRTIANLPFTPYVLLVYGRVYTYNYNGYRAEAEGYAVAYKNGAGYSFGDSLFTELIGPPNREYRSGNLSDVVFGINSVSFNGINGAVGNGGTAYFVFGS